MKLLDGQMQDSLNPNSDHEIDLRELFTTLWAYKVFIASTCVLGIFIGGYYALNADKKFTSEAIFKLDQGTPTGLSLGGNLGVLANVAGFGSGVGGAAFPTDEIRGRIFIEKIDEQLNFKKDPFFNSYNPNSVDPLWKALIKRLIGWQKLPSDPQEAIWQGIASVYSKNVVLKQTLDGALIVLVTHENAVRAAKIANAVMDEIITNSRDKKDIEQDGQLEYLSRTLAKALSDLEVSQSNLKTFALENSALPLESFAVGSLQLDTLREQLGRTIELHDAMAELASLMENKSTRKQDYLSLRQQFPIVDQVEFRRILGQNEVISSWSWPEASSVAAVLDTLSVRKNGLEYQTSALQIDAERFSRALEAYAKLEREAKVAEATYTVLIEQVKAQSMMAGYRPDKSEVYEYAAPSIRPSEPKRSSILALGAVLGLFMGCGLAFAFALRRGVYYSRKSLIAGSQARFMASARALIPLRKCSLTDINILLTKKPRTVLRQLAVEVHKSGASQVVVTASHSKLTGNDVARALASYMQSDTMKVAVINFSEEAEKQEVDVETISVGSFVVTESEGQVSVLTPDNNLPVMELSSKKDFIKNLQSLSSTFDLTFLCADNGDAINLLSALEGQQTFHITLAKTKHTKSDTLSHMRSLLPIQGLLHD